jgi:Icc-related predicted phosphoesterase
MTPTEIIKADAARNGVSPTKVILSIKPDLKAGRSTLMQVGDSVLVVKMIAPYTAELHLFTVEPVRTLIQSIKEFVNKLNESGVRTVYGNADNEGIFQILTAAGVKIQQSDVDGYNWKADVWAQ